MVTRYSIGVRLACLLAILLFGSGCAIPNAFTRFKYTKEQMTWRHAPEERFDRLPDIEPVSLRFVKAPLLEEVLYCRGLLEHLKRTGKAVVSVEFEAFSHLGKYRGYRIVSVEGFPDHSEHGFARQWGSGGLRHPTEELF